MTRTICFHLNTPAYFLIGESLIAPAEPGYSNIPTNRLSGFKVNTLQQRMKNRRLPPNLYVGQLAIIKEDNLPPLKWAMGRIVSVYPESSGLVRVVEIRTSGGVMKRSISKICPLPTEQRLAYTPDKDRLVAPTVRPLWV